MGWFDFLRRKKKAAAPASTLKEIWQGFQQVLAGNNEVLVLMGDLEEHLSGHKSFDSPYLYSQVRQLEGVVASLATALQQMSGGRFPELEAARLRIQEAIEQRLEERPSLFSGPLVVRLEDATEEMLLALGGKGGNLARLKNRLGLPVPDGVVATLAAYRAFMEQAPPGRTGTLLSHIQERLAGLDLTDEDAVARVSEEVRELVLAQPAPPELVRELVAEARRLAADGHALIVRSSGGREDLAATFAGQYESFLGVAPEEVPQRWREVVASQFEARAIIYFHLQGLALEEAAMAVLIQRLVAAQAAGVMFTQDPTGCEPDWLVTSAVWGLGADLVSGTVSAAEYQVSRETGRLLQARPGRQEYALFIREGVIVREPLVPEMASGPVLGETDLEQLAALARILEQERGWPQVVEWVQDGEGQFCIVQSRHLPHGRLPQNCLKIGAAVAAEAVLEGRPAAPGVAAGPVFRLLEGQRPTAAPRGVVLVAPCTTPELAPALPRVAALVTAVGSPTGHLALVAREYGVPALVDASGAMERLPEGQVVTVDATQGKVYRGIVENLLRDQPPRTAARLVESSSLEKLRAVAELILPLTLVDRRSPGFRPDNCRTYHDLTRFAHEKAMQVMFGLMDEVAEGRVPALKLLKLKTDLPLNLHLVDLGDGLARYDTPVDPEDIISRPMRALWRGISRRDITWAGPVPVNMGGFLHVLGQSAIRPPEKFWDKTYAIVGANYVNYACRLGYHFQSVDSYIGDVPANNYIKFTFKGGAADDTRRIRRIRLIGTVLERLGFEMEIHGDVIRGRLRKRPAAEMEEMLDLLGRLMAYVRQMDMLMSDDSIPEILAQRFLEGHYERPGEGQG